MPLHAAFYDTRSTAGAVVGSVSGGCIEDDLIHRYTTAYGGPGMQTGLPEVVRYGVSAEDAHRFGLPWLGFVGSYLFLRCGNGWLGL